MKKALFLAVLAIFVLFPQPAPARAFLLKCAQGVRNAISRAWTLHQARKHGKSPVLTVGESKLPFDIFFGDDNTVLAWPTNEPEITTVIDFIDSFSEFLLADSNFSSLSPEARDTGSLNYSLKKDPSGK